MKIPVSEVYRYLGYGANQPEEKIIEMVQSSITLLTNKAEPKAVHGVFELENEGEEWISFAGMTVSSRQLYKNLQGCEKIAVFAATLGVQADYLLQRYSKIQMSMAVVLQAAAAAMLEEFCDNWQQTLAEEWKEEGFYLRPRFSPGYGDFSMIHQPAILTVLEAGKRIGLAMTDGFLLTPTKSVTGVVGMSKTFGDCPKKGCEECEKQACSYRREEH